MEKEEGSDDEEEEEEDEDGEESGSEEESSDEDSGRCACYMEASLTLSYLHAEVLRIAFVSVAEYPWCYYNRAI